MQLPGLLKERRTSIVDRWTDLTLQVYPRDFVRLMHQEKDRFQNPVGHVTRKSLEGLYDGLLAGYPAEEMAEKLDGILRIRAVQDLSPSAALGFVLLLKRAVRDELDADAATVDLSELDAGIDRLVLQAFDLFTHCREKIYELRLTEIKRRASSLLERKDPPVADGPKEPAARRPSQDTKGGCGA